MLKLSLPGPRPPYSADALEDDKISPKKRKKGKKKGNLPPQETTEERLESFMDKLSMWQLTSTIDAWQMNVSTNASTGNGIGLSAVNKKDERDWTQIFCEDVVEPLYAYLFLFNTLVYC